MLAAAGTAPFTRHAAVTPWQESEGVTAACSVAVCDSSDCTQRSADSGADGLLDVQGQQQLAVELVGAADQVAGLALERVRRRLEVAGVDVDDVGDRVDQQADGLAVQPDDDDDGVGALRPRRAGRAARAARSR